RASYTARGWERRPTVAERRGRRPAPSAMYLLALKTSLRVCPRSPSTRYSGERGWGEGADLPRIFPLTPNPSPPQRGRGEPSRIDSECSIHQLFAVKVWDG